ncbi:MAG: MFS transporter [Micromonosporaceae bacterium]
MAGVRRWWGANVGGLPRTFWFLWTSTLVNRIGGFIVIYLAVYLVAVRDFSPTYAGLVVGLYGGGAALGVLVGGVLADRWGRKPTLVAANLSAAGAAVALGFVSSPLAIALLTGLLGALTQASRPAGAAMMADVVPNADRLRAFSLTYWAINLGFAGSALLAGVLIGLDYRLLFFLDAATTVLAALVVLGVPDTRPAPATAAVSPAAVSPAPAARQGGLIDVLRDRVFLGLVAGTLFTWMIVETVSMLPIAMRADDLSASAYGRVIAVNGILIVLGQLFIPRLLGDRDRSRTLAVAAVIIGSGFGLVALADSLWMYALTVAVWTIGEMVMSPSISSLTADLAPASMRGRYQGVHSFGYSIATFAAPVIAGVTLQYAGPAVLWIGCFVLGLLVAGWQYAAGPARERRIAALRAAESQPPGAALDATATVPAPAPAAA